MRQWRKGFALKSGGNPDAWACQPRRFPATDTSFGIPLSPVDDAPAVCYIHGAVRIGKSVISPLLGNSVTEWASNIPADKAAGEQSRALPPGTIAFEDAVLIDRCRKGDMKAFGSLVAKYQDRLFNMVLRLCGHQADAEELAQEAFLKALERIDQFRGQSQFYTWLYRIAANLAISHRRHAGRIRFGPLSRLGEPDCGAYDAATAALAAKRTEAPPEAAMAADAQRRVLAALEELDDEFRLVVVLRDIEDMDYVQIADVLEVPVGTVKSRLHRGRNLLKDKLADLMG